jgi:transposase
MTLFILQPFTYFALMSPSDSADAKIRELRLSGTLNPKADLVLDDRFQPYTFFDARDLLQVKYEMLRCVRHEGWSVSRAARHFGLSRPTYYQARNAFEQKGLWGLVPERRGPRTPRKLTEAMVESLRGLRVRDPALSWRSLAEHLAQHHGLHVHPRTIKRRLMRPQKKGGP